MKLSKRLSHSRKGKYRKHAKAFGGVMRAGSRRRRNFRMMHKRYNTKT